MKKFYFSPSENHRYLMSLTSQSLSYQGDNIEKWQKKLREKLSDLLGMNEFPKKKTELNPKKLWSKKTKLGTIEKVVFNSEPFSDIPAYICIPDGIKKPYPFMICLQGHSSGMHNSINVSEDESRNKKAKGDRDFAISCMKNGFAAICIEQRSFGERAEKKQKQAAQWCHDAAMHALMLGRTLMGERVYDVGRTIDYLQQRGDADMKRIGIMGNSGGGTITLFSAALMPERIAFAMPSCYFCTFKDSIMSIYHCADNYIPGLFKYAEMWDIAGLIAPRPLLIVAGKTDPIFPISATKKSFKKLKEIYRKATAEHNCKLVIGNEGHRFYAEAAWKAFKQLIKNNYL
ncbi:MAG TPA: alpha/beta hydrolase family protein [Victivallales bacterium]|nr:alpha/beta hydrolase family protein [Victivallales bacterium]HPO89994.1 alpha/beta hydrolase family protein [Victivallales bacterium]HRR27744.1 alpha/beta hydrolase family protein [Victivallales bacterium]